MILFHTFLYRFSVYKLLTFICKEVSGEQLKKQIQTTKDINKQYTLDTLISKLIILTTHMNYTKYSDMF